MMILGRFCIENDEFCINNDDLGATSWELAEEHVGYDDEYALELFRSAKVSIFVSKSWILQLK